MASSQVFSTIVDSLLAEGITVRFRAGGRSMLPTLHDGDCVVVKPVAPADVKLGDVVFCQTSRGPVVHRVVDIDTAARRLTLRGDASLEPDAPVTAAQVRGTVTNVDGAREMLMFGLARSIVATLLLAAGLPGRARPRR